MKWIDQKSTIYFLANIPYEFQLIIRGSRDGFHPRHCGTCVMEMMKSNASDFTQYKECSPLWIIKNLDLKTKSKLYN
ncbi:hypothetical protein Glove_64g54 [Diversispora epigaea]|uniref:Uncharacterized protein n=1 Tax=Diversispora epigaea TaxID=1348612 RepID=A0A397JHX2_9GLOM|nr:hypothetical protein Glove_64g54 [Diversispora epigaea]